jgi:NDP-sugar pyrophosphorylase family protein
LKKEKGMEAIVIAGGRGRRLGALTMHHNKGALRFHGRPAILWVIEALKAARVASIHVVSGHGSESIKHALLVAHDRLAAKINFILGPEETVGMVQRIALAVPSLRDEQGALVMGIDSIISGDAMRSFSEAVEFSLAAKINVIHLLCAADITPAPTHYLVQVINGEVMQHSPQNNADASCVLRSVGIRYFPRGILEKICEDAPEWRGRNISPYISRLLSVGMEARATVLRGRWVHIGYGRDFRSPLP